MPTNVTAGTRLFLLLGDPVDHSASPYFQNAAMQAREVDAVYVALRCDAAAVPALMRSVAMAGGGGNVTVPHKAAAAACLDRATELVTRTGACNAFWREDGHLCGDNTDVAGFRAAAATVSPALRGADVLLIGAGGAAAAAMCALVDEGADRVTLLNRSVPRACALADRFEPTSTRIDVVGDAASLGRRTFDLVVNASSLGMRAGDPLPLDLSRFPAAGAVLDLVYRRGTTTGFVELARSLGVPAADGMDMLVAQGAAAFERWFRVPAPIDAMYASLRGAELGA